MKINIEARKLQQKPGFRHYFACPCGVTRVWGYDSLSKPETQSAVLECSECGLTRHSYDFSVKVQPQIA